MLRASKKKIMTIISDNTIYYTLSTISQTMAAIFAVVGTFVIFQIQATETRLINLLISRANNETLGNSRVRELISAKKFKEASEFFKIEDPSGGLINSDINKLADYKNLIKVTVILSSITIFISVSMLTLADQIKSTEYFNYIFILTTILFSTSLAIVSIKIVRLFK
jgi:hypothetical protein